MDWGITARVAGDGMKLLVVDTEQIVQTDVIDHILPQALRAVFGQLPEHIPIGLIEQTDEFRVQKVLSQQLLLCANEQQTFHIQAHCVNLMRQYLQLNKVHNQVFTSNVKQVVAAYDDDNLAVVLVSKNWASVAKLMLPKSIIDLSFTPLISAADAKNVQALLPKAIQTAQTFYETQHFSEIHLISHNQLMVKTAQLMGWHTIARQLSQNYSQRATALV